MMKLIVKEDACILCKQCIPACPFQAIELNALGTAIEMNAACKMCGICVKVCPTKALLMVKEEQPIADLSMWKNIMVIAEVNQDGLIDVTLELLGKARELADVIQQEVHCVILQHPNQKNLAKEAVSYGADQVFLYQEDSLSIANLGVYANILEACIKEHKPSTVLIGATPLGRSLAPRLATAFRSGLTADCTVLEMKKNTDLVQIRPAFGGNVMAQIITPRSRPQFATVRAKMMNKLVPISYDSLRDDQKIAMAAVSKEMLNSKTRVIQQTSIPSSIDISKAEVLVVVGRGLKQKADMAMIEELATLLHGQVAVTRPLVEQGFCENMRQIGLSGRSVKPKLMIVLGVSGAVQFTAGMSGSECIIAVNQDKDAEIFKVADYGIVADLYTWIPAFLKELKQGKQEEMLHA